MNTDSPRKASRVTRKEGPGRAQAQAVRSGASTDGRSSWSGRTREALLASRLSWVVALILVLLPFHAFLTVWLASATGHYILLRICKECLLLVLAAGVGYLLIKDRSLRQKFLGSRLIQLIILYLLLTIAGGAIAYGLHKVTAKALGYGLIVNLRFLTFFLVNWAITAKSPKLKQWWPKLLLFPAALVILV